MLSLYVLFILMHMVDAMPTRLAFAFDQTVRSLEIKPI